VDILTIEEKVHALIKAIQLATDKGFDRVMFESDFQVFFFMEVLIYSCSLSLSSLIILYLALKLVYLCWNTRGQLGNHPHDD
jgi:Ca2+/Na+ antiporter